MLKPPIPNLSVVAWSHRAENMAKSAQPLSAQSLNSSDAKSWLGNIHYWSDYKERETKMKIPAIVAALPCICLMAIIARAETTCSVAEKLSCAQGQGCQSVNNSIIIRLDEQQKVYSRCDAKGCDDYPAQFTLSGAFINIDVSGHGMLAKLSADGTFTEVVTLGTAVLVSFGLCR